MTTDTLRTLAVRAEAGETGRAFDRDIAKAIGWHRVEPRFSKSKKGGWIRPEDFRGTMSSGAPILDSLYGTDIWPDVPAFSTSLDVVDKELPGRIRRIVWHPHPRENPPQYWAEVETPPETFAFAPTECLARLAAKLRAMAVETEARHDR